MPNLSQQIFQSRVRLGEVLPEDGEARIARQALNEAMQAMTDMVAYFTDQSHHFVYPGQSMRTLLFAAATLARNAGHDLEEDLAQWSYALAAQKKPPEPLPVQRAPLPQEIAGGFIR